MIAKLSMGLAVALVAIQLIAGEPPGLATEEDKVSYSVGVDLARNILRQGVGVKPDVLIRGMRDGFSGTNFLLSDDDLRMALGIFQAEAKQRMLQTRLTPNRVAQLNRDEGLAFLANNKTKPGVVTMPSGLQYKILKAGSGRKPVETDTVECHYRGTFVNGIEFDNTYERGQSAVVKLADAMPGWKEALELMPVGSKWQLYIPAPLAFGPRGSSARGSHPGVGPNATVLFEMELVAIK
jgi:FKBP-type peptidyl-prolyl cis-trans isomerase